MADLAATCLHLEVDGLAKPVDRFPAVMRAIHGPHHLASKIEAQLASVDSRADPARPGVMPVPATIKSWLAGKSPPSAEHMDRIVAAYGADFLTAYYGEIAHGSRLMRALRLKTRRDALAREEAEFEASHLLREAILAGR